MHLINLRRHLTTAPTPPELRSPADPRKIEEPNTGLVSADLEGLDFEDRTQGVFRRRPFPIGREFPAF
jgi:hypothetical protein